MLRRVLGAIVSSPVVYDAVQFLAGREENYRRLRPLLATAKGELLLEAGAGTGEIVRLLDPTTRYLWLDNDRQKLSGFLTKRRGELAVLGDASRLPFADSTVHTVLTIAVTHHLTDSELDNFLAEMARVCRTRLVFLDCVEDRSSWASRILFRYDRGSFPRPPDVLLQKIKRYFAIEELHEYKIFHRYVLCTARPIQPEAGSA